MNENEPTARLNAKEVKEITEKYQVLSLVDLEMLEKFKGKYYPAAEYVAISADSEYNDEGYSSECHFEFFGLDNQKLPRPDFGEDWKKEDEFYDEEHSVGNRRDVGDEFHAPEIKYFFSDGTVSV